MDKLLKIRDVSGKYNITARTLRYYEDMGLLTSIRSDEVSYRMYDENAVRRIEQILILRKLNISIKDIKQLYSKAKEIETQIVNVDYIGKPANIHRLFEITDKLDKKVPDVIYGS